MNEHAEDTVALAVEAEDGGVDVMYAAQPYQMRYHESSVPNLLLAGPRGTGKSMTIRMDAHMRAITIPGFRYMIVRRTMKQLRTSHLIFIDAEMTKLGGFYHKTDSQAHYPNGSIGFFLHCETEGDISSHLGSQYDMAALDEMTTFSWDMITKLAATVRVPRGSGRIGLFRGGTNPLGPSAVEVKKHFITKDVNYEEEEDYVPDEWGVIEMGLTDNKYLDVKDYRKRLRNLPLHVRRAWLDGEWIDEGTYFSDYRPTINGKPWHVINTLPTVKGRHVLDQPWINVYRCFDWGYSPDPAVCLWIAVMPDGTEIVFKERTWRQVLAADVAQAIRRESQGMRIIETFADPSMFAKSGETQYSVGEIIENNRVPLSKSLNDRERFGYAVHDHLNTLINERPKLQILAPQGDLGCPELIRTLSEIQMDKKDPRKLANGNDHYVVALAYFCIGQAPPSKDPEVPKLPKYLLPKVKGYQRTSSGILYRQRY